MKNKKYAKVLNLFINLSLFFFTVIAILMIAECFCYFFYDETNIYEDYVIDGLRTNAQYNAEAKHYVDPVNGLKYVTGENILSEQYKLFGDDFKENKNEGTVRVVVLGDSFTMGGGLPDIYQDQNMYTKQLERLLNKNGSTTYEVLAFADGGLNTFQELVIFKKMAINYDPDILILQYCDNDISPPKSELGFDHSGLYIRSKTRLLFIENKLVPELPGVGLRLNKIILANSALARYLSFKLNLIFEENTISKNNTGDSFAALKEINEVLKNKKIPFIIINFPLAYEEQNYCDFVRGGYGGKILHDKLRQFSKSNDINFLNMCDRVADIRDIKSKHFDSGSCHYGEEGYGLAAEMLAELVSSSTIFNIN